MASLAAPLKLHYFDAPGRAETARLCLTLGHIPFEDVTYSFAQWPAAKPTMPFGQVPVLEFPDGTKLAQSGAIDRYVAKLAGLYPEDPRKAALVDQAMGLLADLWETFATTHRLPTVEERVAARQEILKGPAHEKLTQLAALMEGALSSGGYVAGDKLSLGDVAVFTGLTGLICGRLDGIPKDLLDSYPALRAFRNKIASEPAIKAYYETHSEGYRAAYKPDAQ